MGFSLIAGGGTAATISTGFAEFGLLLRQQPEDWENPVETTETAGAGLMSVLAMAAPIFAGILAIIFIFLAVSIGRKAWKKLEKKQKYQFRLKILILMI
jgi:hypothetical protein